MLAAKERSLPQNGTEDRADIRGAREVRNLQPGTDETTAKPVINWELVSLTRPLLLRKEVIQPHLPVRLPCYDFTPITDPTFDGSLPKGLGHRLRVLPTFVV